jgi:cobalt transporter subunit CbtB
LDGTAIEERRMATQAAIVSLPLVKSRASEIVQALAAMALGLLVIGTVGFANISAVHNAAHDVRHATAFPCH